MAVRIVKTYDIIPQDESYRQIVDPKKSRLVYEAEAAISAFYYHPTHKRHVYLSDIYNVINTLPIILHLE